MAKLNYTAAKINQLLAKVATGNIGGANNKLTVKLPKEWFSVSEANNYEAPSILEADNLAALTSFTSFPVVGRTVKSESGDLSEIDTVELLMDGDEYDESGGEYTISFSLRVESSMGGVMNGKYCAMYLNTEPFVLHVPPHMAAGISNEYGRMWKLCVMFDNDPTKVSLQAIPVRDKEWLYPTLTFQIYDR